LKKQRRIQVIALAVVALAISTALIGYAMRDGINFFRSPSQVVEEPPARKALGARLPLWTPPGVRQ
jgi:cytochrome c-type biogenesis protein CcmE